MRSVHCVLHELNLSLFQNFMRCLLFGSSWSSFLQFAKYPPWVLCPRYFMLQQLNGTQLICCRLQKNLVSGFSSNVTCCISAEEKGQQRRVCVSAVLSPEAFSLPPSMFPSRCAEGPAVMTSLRSVEHLQPGRGLRQSGACLCWWHLLPQGPGIISPLFTELLNVNLCLWILLYVGVWWVRETVRRALACTHIVVVKWKWQYD